MDEFSPELRLLKRFNSLMECELMQRILEKHGIAGVIKNSGLQFPRDLGDSFGSDLFVAEGDLNRAWDILKAYSSDNQSGNESK